MDAKLQTILDRFTDELKGWLESPSETSGRIEALRAEIEKLKGELGGTGLSDALRALETADKAAQRERVREASEAIARACKPLGLNLEVKAPAKRRPRASRPTP